MSERRTALFFTLLLLLALRTEAADVPAFPAHGFPPPTYDVRREFRETAEARLSVLEVFVPRTVASRVGGVPVRVSTEANSEYRYLVFTPEYEGLFELDQPGTYILRRRVSDGGIDQIKIFLRAHQNFFVRLYPSTDSRSTMSVYLAGVETHRRMPLPVSVLQALEMPLAELLDLTAARVDWQLFYPAIDPSEHRTVALVADRARSMLHTLPDAEDGAMDEHGRLVLIDSLVLQDQQAGFNCSGFAKWIADGLAMAQFGRYLAIEPLKRKHTELRGTSLTDRYEQERDPFFGLDWTRNLAVSLRSPDPQAESEDPESADVRHVRYASYVEDAGFRLAELELVLFLKASREPGHLYFASLSREVGSTPSLRQHVHVAVLFPYFDGSGEFRVAVMERNVESSLSSLQSRYSDGHIHLVRVRAHEGYTPPVILY